MSQTRLGQVGCMRCFHHASISLQGAGKFCFPPYRRWSIGSHQESYMKGPRGGEFTSVEVSFNVTSGHGEHKSSFECHPIRTIGGEFGYRPERFFIGHVILSGAHNLLDEEANWCTKQQIVPQSVSTELVS